MQYVRPTMPAGTLPPVPFTTALGHALILSAFVVLGLLILVGVRALVLALWADQ